MEYLVVCLVVMLVSVLYCNQLWGQSHRRIRALVLATTLAEGAVW